METLHADALRLIMARLSPIDAVQLASTCTKIRKRLRNEPHIKVWEDRWHSQWQPLTHTVHTLSSHTSHINEACAQAANIAAVRTGDLRLVKIFSVMIPRWSLYVAARLQHSDVFAYLLSKLTKFKDADRIMEHATAVREGKLSKQPVYNWMLMQAAEHGDLEAIQCRKWILTHRHWCQALIRAAAAGHLHILQWEAEENSCDVNDACAKSSHVHILQWWATRPHFHWYGYIAYYTAVRNNAIQALDFLLQVMPKLLSHNQKFELCKGAVTYNCTDAFKWLCSNGMIVRRSRIVRGILRRRTKFPKYAPALNAMLAHMK
jgi:hypothetical protein